MQLVLTTAGAALLASSSLASPLVLTKFVLGNGVNYTPSVSDTDIHGGPVNIGQPSAPNIVNANLLRYSIIIDPSSGPFDFGEVGLYQSTTLVALGSFSTLQHKVPASNNAIGGIVKIDCYISIVGNSYAVLADATNTSATVRLPVLASIDALPQPVSSSYNTYVCLTTIDDYVTTLATAEGNLWSFTGYESVASAPR
jgi:hypothetical protein